MQFVKRFNFIFARFTPTAYYFAIILNFRNFLRLEVIDMQGRGVHNGVRKLSRKHWFPWIPSWKTIKMMIKHVKNTEKLAKRKPKA